MSLEILLILETHPGMSSLTCRLPEGLLKGSGNGIEVDAYGRMGEG
jgi:hypothetical protein